MTLNSQDSAVARWLPGAQFRERHEAWVAHEPGPILDVLSSLEDRDDAIVRRMLKLREMPSRLWGALGGRSALTGKGRFGMSSFTQLERGETVLVLGLAGRFWRLDFGLADIPDAQAFRDFNDAGAARLVMTFVVESRRQGAARLITETHVHCPDTRSLVMFAPYWIVIRLGSGLIRRRMLRLVQRRLADRIHGQV